MDRVRAFCGLPGVESDVAFATDHKFVGCWEDHHHQERLPFLRVPEPCRNLVVFLVLLACPIMSRAQSQPAIFAVFQGDHGLGCCNNNLYNLSTGGNTQFVQSGESITGSFGDASLAISLHIFEDGATTDGDGGRLDVYVLGPPGTPFRLQYTYTQGSSAINQSSGGYLTTIFFQGFQSFGFQVSPGSSNQKNVSGGDTVVGTTSAQTITYLGQTYSLAWSAGHLIEVGANTCCGSYTGHAEADLNFSVTLISNCTFGIVPSTAGVDALGETGSVALTASQPTCAWTANSNASWLTVTSGTSGSGSGTIGYTAAANISNAPRQGTLTIGGQVFTVAQAGVNLTLALENPTAPPSDNPNLKLTKATVTVVDTNGKIIPSFGVSFRAEPVNWHISGHLHNNIDQMQASSFLDPIFGLSSTSCSTDSSGSCSLLYVSPIVSGIFRVTSTSIQLSSLLDTRDLLVKVPGVLTSLSFGSTYRPTGDIPGAHVDNHNGTLYLRTAITSIGNAYFSLTGQTLGINDMSLPLGGVFDISDGIQRTQCSIPPQVPNCDWVPPHHLHRVGKSVDIDHSTKLGLNGPDAQINLLLLDWLAARWGLFPINEGNIHYESPL